MIDIEINDFKNALNPFNPNLLSTELDNYLLSSCEFISLKNEPLCLNIKNITGKNQKKLANIIHNFYQNKLRQYKIFKDLEYQVHFIFFIIGILAILISEIFTSFLSEIFLIAAWVIVWELIYDLLFNQIKKRKKAKIYKYLANAKINFID